MINRHHKLGDKKFADCPSLITGDIRELDENRLKQIEQDLRDIDPSIHFGAEGTVDVLAGGPPCQGYSGIGHRRSYSVDKENSHLTNSTSTWQSLSNAFNPRFFF